MENGRKAKVSVRKSKNLIVIVLCILAAIIVFAVIISAITKVTVPDVKNDYIEKAISKLENAGFERDQITTTEKIGDIDLYEERYVVTAQSVSAGVKIHASAGIELTVEDLYQIAAEEIDACTGMSLDRAISIAEKQNFSVRTIDKKDKEIKVEEEKRNKWQVIDVGTSVDTREVDFIIDTKANIKKKEEEEAKKVAKERDEAERRLELYDKLQTTIGKAAPKAVKIVKKYGYKYKIMDLDAIEQIEEDESLKDVLTEDITWSYDDKSPAEGYTYKDYRNSLIIEDTAINDNEKVVSIFVRDNQNWLKKKYGM